MYMYIHIHTSKQPQGLSSGNIPRHQGAEEVLEKNLWRAEGPDTKKLLVAEGWPQTGKP